MLYFLAEATDGAMLVCGGTHIPGSVYRLLSPSGTNQVMLEGVKATRGRLVAAQTALIESSLLEHTLQKHCLYMRLVLWAFGS